MLPRLFAVVGRILLTNPMLTLNPASADAAQPDQVARNFHYVFNTGDAAAFAALFTESATVTITPSQEVVQGRAAIRARFVQGFADYPQALMLGWPEVSGDTATWLSTVWAGQNPGKTALHRITLAGDQIQSAVVYLPPVPEWSYITTTGPAHWAALDGSYADCAEGRSQSPVDLAGAAAQPLAELEFHYQPSALHFFADGRTLQVNYAAGSYLLVGGARYDLLQFHFHAPSEHTVNGRRFPGEWHLVHRSGDGQLAVVGLLVREMRLPNTALRPIWNNIPRINNRPPAVTPLISPAETVNAADLLPAVQTTYRYSGSLTTPPCSEGVSWFVMTEPIHMSPAQVSSFEYMIGENNRPVQPLNGREVSTDLP